MNFKQWIKSYNKDSVMGVSEREKEIARDAWDARGEADARVAERLFQNSPRGTVEMESLAQAIAERIRKGD